VTGIFNLADVLLMAGAAMMAWPAFKTPKDEDDEPRDDADKQPAEAPA
jgi:lipoprotein signal peptidase